MASLTYRHAIMAVERPICRAISSYVAPFRRRESAIRRFSAVSAIRC